MNLLKAVGSTKYPALIQDCATTPMAKYAKVFHPPDASLPWESPIQGLKPTNDATHCLIHEPLATDNWGTCGFTTWAESGYIYYSSDYL